MACWRRNRFLPCWQMPKQPQDGRKGSEAYCFIASTINATPPACFTILMLLFTTTVHACHCPFFVAHTCVAFPCARLRPTNDPSFLERTRLDRLDHNVVFVWWESERKKVSLTVVNVVVVSMAQTINGITPVSAASFALSTMPFVRLARAKHASYCTCETYLCRCMAAITREIPFAGAIDS